MSGARHTPGPWTIEPDVWPHRTHIGPNVAEVKTYDREHCEANARLIARAWELPELEAQRDELLEAAKNGLGYAKSATAISVYAQNDVEKIEQAIAKAEGHS